MRPLQLKLKGLRSYHAERTIPLEDESLLAIIGDTGAGKSSLLEAIVFALYAGSTWDGKEASELISDRARTMVVELKFTAEGETWQVRRTMSLGTTAAEHELVCVSDPSKPRVTGREANSRIRALIGLSREQFCSAVLLPQGRFETLVRATEGQRVALLKGLLGLERAERVRDQASELRGLFERRLLEISDRRALFLPDPESVRRTAEQKITEVEPEAHRFEQAQHDFEAAERDAAAKERQADALDQTAETLGGRLTGDAARLDRLDKIERDIVGRREPVARQLKNLEERLADLAGELTRAKREKRDQASLERAIEVLISADEDLKTLADDETALTEGAERCPSVRA